MDNNRKKVFVYGTLRKGYGNHFRRLDGKDSVFMGTGKTIDKMNMIAHGYPMVSDEYSDENDNFITGELYEVDNSTLHGPLDGLEGHPNLFKRKETKILMDDGTEDVAWMYYYYHSGSSDFIKAVPSGDFSIHIKENQ